MFNWLTGNKRERPESFNEITVQCETASSTESNPNDVERSVLPKQYTLDQYRLPAALRDVNTVSERLTLAQLFLKAVPDAETESPHVVIVGSQTAGKTKLIISLVFHHLVDNEHFDDDVGEQLLKIFRTGTKMVTRRPTTVHLNKSEECKVSIDLSGQSGTYPEQEFHDIVSRVIAQSKDTNHAYQDELIVNISAPLLPNCTFTDLPGIITKDRALTGSSGEATINSMVRFYANQPRSTVVVVEPATVEDFETSHISPMMRELMQTTRPDIFANSVLVLSKCDKIKGGLEPGVMRLIDLTSDQLGDYPYKHVVGVVNKVDSDEAEPECMTFTQFQESFHATRSHERNTFEAFRNSDGSKCDPETQCTTSAVFNKMEQISFDMVQHSIADGVRKLDLKIDHVRIEVKRTLAPPIQFYDGLSVLIKDITVMRPATNSVATSTSNSKSSTSGSTTSDTASTVSHKPASAAAVFTRLTSIDEFRSNFSKQLITQLQSVRAFSNTVTGRNNFVTSHLHGWPEPVCGDIGIMLAHVERLAKVETHIHTFVDALTDCVSLALCGETVVCAPAPSPAGNSGNSISNNGGGCFTLSASPFHRVDRFPALCEKLHHHVSIVLLPQCIAATKRDITAYMVQQKSHSTAEGLTLNKLFSLLDTLHNMAVFGLYQNLTHALSAVEAPFPLTDGLFVESAEMQRQRQLLQNRPFELHRQKSILHSCLSVTSNDELREALLNSGNVPPGAGNSDGGGNSSSSSSNSNSSSSSVSVDVAQSVGAAQSIGVNDPWREFWLQAAEEHFAHHQDRTSPSSSSVTSTSSKRQQQSSSTLTANTISNSSSGGSINASGGGSKRARKQSHVSMGSTLTASTSGAASSTGSSSSSAAAGTGTGTERTGTTVEVVELSD